MWAASPNDFLFIDTSLNTRITQQHTAREHHHCGSRDQYIWHGYLYCSNPALPQWQG